MSYRYVTAQVEVDLSEFDTDDLVEELEARGLDYNTQGVDGDQQRELLEQIYNQRRLGQDYQQNLDLLIWNILGRM